MVDSKENYKLQRVNRQDSVSKGSCFFKPFQVTMIVQNTSFLQCLSALPGKETDAGTLSGKRHDKDKAWEPLPEAIHMYLFPIISKHYPANG